MAWVVDTCLLLDIALADPIWASPSARLLDRHRKSGLVVCPVATVELAPSFGGSIDDIRAFYGIIGISEAEGWTHLDTRLAAEGWHRHIGKKRQGLAPKRPVADVLIGGFAMRFAGLLSRNPLDFRHAFPNLTIREPIPA